MSKPDYDREIIDAFGLKLEQLMKEAEQEEDREVYFKKMETLFKIYKYFKHFDKLDKYLEPKILELEREEKMAKCKETDSKEM